MTPYKIVVLAGSGRSGTTWLGSILDSYEGAEYFYEPGRYPELQYDGPGLLRAKYPFIHRLPRRPRALRRLDRGIAQRLAERGVRRQDMQRACRIHHPSYFRKSAIDSYVFKEVMLLQVAMRARELHARLQDRFTLIHVVRNPCSQIASEIRQHAKDLGRAQARFRERMAFVAAESSLSAYHDLAARHMQGSWIEHMVVLWRIANEMVLELDDAWRLRVVYEDLCRRPHEETARLFAQLGWRLSEQTRSHIRATTGIDVSEEGNWSIKKNAEEAMSRWRGELAADDYETIRRVIAGSPLLSLWDAADLTR